MGKRWKETEREIARRVGGERIPVTGRARGSAPDVAHEHFAVEVKHRQRLPRWLWDALDQAVKAVRGEQVPLVVLHESGRWHDNDLVVMRLVDFEEWTRYYGWPDVELPPEAWEDDDA